MKANELMIGDWVLTLDSTHKEKVYAQIWAIEEGQRSILVKKDISNWFVDIEWIEPIPITLEILEKNGFTHYGESWYLPEEECVMVGFHMHNTVIDVKKGFNGGLNGFYMTIPCGYRSCNSNRCVYVHELQHALCLCGIEKEIEL